MAKITKNPEIYQPDKKDIEIIKILEEEGRIPILKLAKRVKLSHETVRYRMNKLVKKGIIKKFTVRIDEKKLGYNIIAVIMLGLWNYSREEWGLFLKELMNNNNVFAIDKVTGNYDLKIAIMAKDPEEFDNISSRIKTMFSKIIKEWETFIFTKEYKWKEIPF